MNLVIYDKNDRRTVIIAYKNCIAIPQRNSTIVIQDELYEVATEPCYCFDKNTVWIFVKKVE